MNEIVDILESGDPAKKIGVLAGLSETDEPEIIEKMITRLDDDDIRVRGEAFSSLVLNENKISDFLIKSLDSTSKNIRGFASLVLANRNETAAIPSLIRLARDERSMVRSCAVGALGYLNAGSAEAREALLQSLLDMSTDVKKSAAHAVITTGTSIPPDVLEKISGEWEGAEDPELLMLLERLRDV